MNDTGTPERVKPHRDRLERKPADDVRWGTRVEVPIDMVEASSWQVRRTEWGPEEDSLARNVQSRGLNQPPLARPHPTKPGWYQIVAGHRRFEVCKRLGWPTIPLEVRDLSDEEAAEIGMEENLQRKSLNPIEEARGYKMLIDEFGLTHEKLALKFEKSRSYITNSLSLLKLDLFLAASVESGALSKWQVRIIMGLPQKFYKYRLAILALNWNLKVYDLVKLVSEIKEGAIEVTFNREVLVKGLYFDLINNIPNFDEPPLSPNGPSVRIDVTGAVIRGGKAFLEAKKNGVEKLLCRIVFRVEYLEQRGELVQISSSITKPGIIPPKSEKQLMKMMRMRSMLEGHEEEYPSVVVESPDPPDPVRARASSSQS